MKGLGKTTETFGQTNWFSVLAFETGTSEISCRSANHSAMVFSKMVKVSFFVIQIHSGSITDFINKIPYFFSGGRHFESTTCLHFAILCKTD
jgi:hypothetical protein